MTFATQTSAESAELISEPFNETLRTAANTGGARLMGMQFVGSGAENNLSAVLPSDWGGKTFCVRTGSSDGLYDSENTYRAPSNTQDPVEIPHVERSEHSKRLGAFEGDDFGVHILLSDCETATRRTMRAVALWRATAPAGSFTIFVNSFDATRLVAFPSNGAPVECQPIASSISVAYDKACSISFSAAETMLEVELLPSKDGLAGRAEFVTIQLK